jgi:hypothetical protein
MEGQITFSGITLRCAKVLRPLTNADTGFEIFTEKFLSGITKVGSSCCIFSDRIRYHDEHSMKSTILKFID